MKKFTITEILDNMSNLYYFNAMLEELNKDSEMFTSRINTLVDIFINEKLANEEGLFMRDLDLSYAELTRRLINIIVSENRFKFNTETYGHIEPKISDKLEIGAILYASWGYDQTNIDFYCVVAETEKMIILIPMNKSYNENGFMSGKSKAVCIDFEDETFRCKKGNYVKVSSCSRARLWAGQELYESHYA